MGSNRQARQRRFEERGRKLGMDAERALGGERGHERAGAQRQGAGIARDEARQRAGDERIARAGDVDGFGRRRGD